MRSGLDPASFSISPTLRAWNTRLLFRTTVLYPMASLACALGCLIISQHQHDQNWTPRPSGLYHQGCAILSLLNLQQLHSSTRSARNPWLVLCMLPTLAYKEVLWISLQNVSRIRPCPASPATRVQATTSSLAWINADPLDCCRCVNTCPYGVSFQLNSRVVLYKPKSDHIHSHSQNLQWLHISLQGPLKFLPWLSGPA